MYSKIYLMNLVSEFIPSGANILNVGNSSPVVKMRTSENSFIVVEYIYKSNCYTMILVNKDSKWEIENIYDTISYTENNSNEVTDQRNRIEQTTMNNGGMDKEDLKVSIPIPIIKATPGPKNYLPDELIKKIQENEPTNKGIKIDGEYVVDSIQGDINGDKIPDMVYLIGVYENEQSELVSDLKLVVKYGGSDKKDEISIPQIAGYRPRVRLYNFEGKSCKDILVSMFAAGVGGYAYYYIYSYQNGKLMEIFNYDKYNDINRFSAKFIDNYRVEIISERAKKLYLLDISNKHKDYLSQLYDSNGILKRPINASVKPLDYMYPVDLDADHKYDIDTFNRITGLNNSDTLGFIETYLLWNGEDFIPISQYIVTYGESMS